MDGFLTGFLKKPLVAVSLLVIVSMCVSAAAGAPRAEHRRRHQPRAAQQQPRAAQHQPLRHHNHSPATFTHDIVLYKNATLKITKRLKNTNRYFKEDLRRLESARRTRNGNPSWLPKVNFVDIHTRNKNFRSLEQRFHYLTPRLLKHLREYKEIFTRLLRVETLDKSDRFLAERQRRRFLDRTFEKLEASITEITDAMESVGMPLPAFHPSTMNFQDFRAKVDATQSDLQDHIAYRGYENLLKSWKLEFKCSKKRMETTLDCRKYEEQLLRRKSRKKT